MGGTRARACIGAVVILSFALGAPAAAAGAGDARDITRFACPVGQVPSAGFVDTAGHVHEQAIDCLAWYEVTRGSAGKAYEPGAVVTRAQMAGFLVRLVDKADEGLLPAYTANRFTDVPATHTFVTEINRLAAAGVVAGGPGSSPDSEFGPALAVGRAQMASFVARTYRLVAGVRLPPGSDCFADDAGSVHEASVNAVCAAGIAQGRAPGVFAPHDPVQRGAMAAFLSRLVDLLVEQGHMVAPVRADVALHANTVAAGQQLAGSITGQGITRATVQGCGLAVGTEVTRAADGGFTIVIPAGQPDGRCTLRFTVSFRDGASEVHDRTITVRSPRVDIASVTVAPAADAVLTASTATGSTTDRGRRQLTVTATTPDGRPAAQGVVDLRLVDAGAVTAAGAPPRFARGADGAATLARATHAVIEVVDGAAQPNGTRSVSGLRLGPAGSATVVVDSTAADLVRLVAFADAADDNTLKLSADGAPASGEVAAVSGLTRYLPDPASTFAGAESGLVTYLDGGARHIGVQRNAVNGAAVSFPATDRLYTYDTNDQYRLSGTVVSQSAFLAALTRADVVKVGPYSTDSRDISLFEIVSDNPQPPQTAAKADGATVTVTITGTNPKQAELYGKFVVQRAPVTSGTAGQSNGTVGAWTTVGEPTADGDPAAGFQFKDANVPNGMYRYRTAGVVDGQQSGWSTATTNLAVGPTGVTPRSLTLAVGADNGPGGGGAPNSELDRHDRLTGTFDQAMSVSSAWEIRLVDGDGTVARLHQGNTTATVGGTGNRQLTLQLTADPQIQASGAVGTFNLGSGGGNFAQVLSASGISGTGGAWNLPASGVAPSGGTPMRTFVGTNDRFPAAATQVSVNASSSTVTVGAASNVNTGEQFLVYDARGTQIASGTKAAGDTTVTASPAFGPNQTLYVVYADTVGTGSVGALSRSLAVATGGVTISGVSPASGSRQGGTTVTVTGTGFTSGNVKTGGGCTVRIETTCLASVANVTATSFTGVTAAYTGANVNSPLLVSVAGANSSSVTFTYTNQPPTATAADPVVSGSTVQLTGTAADADGAVVRVEVRYRPDASATWTDWNVATGATSWSYTTASLAAGLWRFEIRSVDSNQVGSAVLERSATVS